ncbi:MAG: alkaline phosphatase [Verrucomicrobia bacterium]|nr:alkaline phosphatase [Verrucomicrobiota bacterium]
MRMFFGFFLLICLSAHRLVSDERAQAEAVPASARNAILFIGDGLGINTLSIVRAYSGGANGRLQIEQLPHTAFSRTTSDDSLVTDSAAAAAALASGCKTPNRSLNVLKDGRRPPLISQLAKKSGRSVGIVTTTRLTDATPAAFYGYVEKREMEAALVPQMIDSGFDVILGGGLAWLLPKSKPPGVREDGQDLLPSARDKGWTILQDAKALTGGVSFPPDARWLGLFAAHDFSYADERAQHPGEPGLTEMTLAAMRKLARNPKGYFLMVEGGLIDKAAHQNWAWRAFQETIEFDRAIGAALHEAGTETLVIVTADHETGGLALNGYPPITARGNALLARQPDQGFLLGWASGPGALSATNAVSFLDPVFRQPATRYARSAFHTSTDVLIAATGPGSEAVRGFLDNTEIFAIIRRALGL